LVIDLGEFGLFDTLTFTHEALLFLITDRETLDHVLWKDEAADCECQLLSEISFVDALGSTNVLNHAAIEELV